jgi:hypothetical protein
MENLTPAFEKSSVILTSDPTTEVSRLRSSSGSSSTYYPPPETVTRHEYVLIHISLISRSLQLGLLLAKKAVEQDEQQNLDEAMNFYRKSLDYFYKAMSEEHDPNLKKTIGDKMKLYLSRAEQLKAMLASSSKTNPSAPPLIEEHNDPSCEFCKVTFRPGESYKVFQEKIYHIACVDKAAGC